MQQPPQGPPWQGSPPQGSPPQQGYPQQQQQAYPPQQQQAYPQQQQAYPQQQQAYPQQHGAAGPGLAPGQTPLPMRKRIDLAARGVLFLVTLGLAFILVLATPLGDTINMWQAGGPGGTYSPKLTFLVVLVLAAVPMVVVYFALRLLVINRLPDK